MLYQYKTSLSDIWPTKNESFNDNYDNNEIGKLWNKYIIDYNLSEPSYNNELFESKYQSIKEYKLIDSKKRLPPIKVTESNCSKGEKNKDIFVVLFL